MTSVYTHEQERALFWARIFPGAVSALCSAFVVYVLIRDSFCRLDKVYGRIWLGLSVGNMMVALLTMMSSIPAPSGSFYGSRGTTETCTAFGFFYHFFMVFTSIYNASLGLYYLIAVHWNWSEQQVRKRAEPYMHLLAFVYPTVGAIIGVIYEFYNPHDIFLTCWPSAAPLGCRQELQDDITESCNRGEKYRAIFIFWSGLIEFNQFTWVKMMSVPIILYTVKKQQRKMSSRYFSDKASLLTRETLIQSFLFLLTCLIPYLGMILLRWIDIFWQTVPGTAPRSFFIFSICAQTLYPTQGILNLIIYFRPKYSQRQRTKPNESKWDSLIYVLSPPNLSPRSSSAATTTKPDGFLQLLSKRFCGIFGLSSGAGPSSSVGDVTTWNGGDDDDDDGQQVSVAESVSTVGIFMELAPGEALINASSIARLFRLPKKRRSDPQKICDGGSSTSVMQTDGEGQGDCERRQQRDCERRQQGDLQQRQVVDIEAIKDVDIEKNFPQDEDSDSVSAWSRE